MKLLLTILCSVMITSCPNKNEQNIQEESIFTSLYIGRLSGSEGVKEQNKTISSEKELRNFTSKLNIDQKSILNIDFSKSTLLILIDAVKNTGGYSIGIEGIKKGKNSLLVSVERKGPNPTDMVTMAIEQPFHIVRINKTDKEIIFVTK